MPQGGSFSLTGEALVRLAVAFSDHAETVEAAIAPFREGAIDGMATAWGDAGAETRGSYLENVAQIPPQIEQIAALLRSVSMDLIATAQRSEAADQGVAAMFDGVLGGGTGGVR